MIALYTAAHRDVLFAILLLLLGGAGLLDIRYGAWQPGPGVGNYLIPMVAYWVLVGAGAALLAGRLRPSKTEESVLTLSPWPVMAGLIWAGVYFIAVRYVGVAVSTSLFMAAAIWCLSPSGARGSRGIGIVSLASGAIFWVLFTQLAPILVSRQLLF